MTVIDCISPVGFITLVALFAVVVFAIAIIVKNIVNAMRYEKAAYYEWARFYGAKKKWWY